MRSMTMKVGQSEMHVRPDKISQEFVPVQTTCGHHAENLDLSAQGGRARGAAKRRECLLGMSGAGLTRAGPARSVSVIEVGRAV